MMPYTIEILGGDRRATVNNRRWTSEHKLFEESLNLDVPNYVSGADPDPDHTLALQAARKWHGRIIGEDPVEPTD